MKTAIKSSALLVVLALLSTGVFATDKTTEAPAASNKKDVVLFTSLSTDCGVAVAVHKANAGTPEVKIFDKNGNAILTDKLSKKDVVAQKGYNLSELEDGDYTFKVTTNNNVTERLVHVYTDGNDQKSFFFKM